MSHHTGAVSLLYIYICKYILIIRKILEGVRAKKNKNKLHATILFVDFTKAFDSIHRGKIEQILLAYGIPKETVAAITILYRNTKVKVSSPDGDTDYFDICSRSTARGHTSPIPLYHLCRTTCLEHRLIKSKKTASSWQRKEAEGTLQKQLPIADYADDIAILANTPV